MDIVTAKAIAGDLKGITLHGRIDKEDNGLIVYGCKLEDKMKLMNGMKMVIYKELGERLDVSEIENILNTKEMTYKVKENEYKVIKE